MLFLTSLAIKSKSFLCCDLLTCWRNFNFQPIVQMLRQDSKFRILTVPTIMISMVSSPLCVCRCFIYYWLYVRATAKQMLCALINNTLQLKFTTKIDSFISRSPEPSSRALPIIYYSGSHNYLSGSHTRLLLELSTSLVIRTVQIKCRYNIDQLLKCDGRVITEYENDNALFHFIRHHKWVASYYVLWYYGWLTFFTKF